MLVTKAVEVAATPPNEMAAPETKLEPDTVTLVPPDVLPELGETEFTVGAGAEPAVDFGKIVPSLRNAPGAAFR